MMNYIINRLGIKMSRLITLVMISTFSLHAVAVPVSAQSKEYTLRDFFEQIENDTDFMFFYQTDEISLSEKVSVEYNKPNFQEPLEKALHSLGYDYVIEGSEIVVFKTKSEKLANSIKSTPETKDIVVTGSVVDVHGLPIPGASILIKGTLTGTISGNDGDFSLKVPYAEATLIVSFIGYAPETIELANRTIIEVVLKDSQTVLDEAVVVAYGVQRKVTITGALSTISTKELSQSPVANVTNALAGRMPGLTVTQYGGGEPGKDNGELRIRGTATYNTDAQGAVVIVDGVERSFSDLSPDEIDTFTILKDASATALYGVRGANGVIVITTKRGVKSEKPVVEFKAQVGMAEPVKFPDYLGSADYATLFNQALKNDNPGWATDPAVSNRLFPDEMIGKWKNAEGFNNDGNGYDIDYFDYAFKPAVQQDYSVSISGGNDRARYFALVRHFNQGGNYNHSNLNPTYDTNGGYNRTNLRSNIDIDITKRLYVNVGLGGHITSTKQSGGESKNIIYTANTTPSMYPIVLENTGSPANNSYYLDHPDGLLFGNTKYRKNILGEMAHMGYILGQSTNFNGTFSAGHKLDFITEGLKIDFLFSYDMTESQTTKRQADRGAAVVNEYYGGYATFFPTDGDSAFWDINQPHYGGSYSPARPDKIVNSVIGNAFERGESVSKTYYQLALNYTRNFGAHGVTGLLMGNRSQKKINEQVPFRYEGLAGRITYNYDHRYLLEVNAGLNGSENFAKNNRYGFFPSVSVGWIISEEGFMSGTKNWLDFLKIRASYGLSGNDQGIGRFLYVQYYNAVDQGSYRTGLNYDQGMGGSLEEGDLANPNLTWEKGEKANVGIDITLFERKLSVSVDAFYERRYDIITNTGGGAVVGIPDVLGKVSSMVNAGEVINKGIDAEISWNHRVNRDFSYYIGFNGGFSRNKIIEQLEIPRNVPWMQTTGGRIGEHYMYEVSHFVKDQAEADRLNSMNGGTGFQKWGKLSPGDVVYKDLNNDGIIDELHDKRPMGNPKTPEIQFGIPMGFTYKNFDLSLLFQGAALTSLKLNGPAVWDFPVMGAQSNDMGKVKGMHLDSWTPENTGAKYPALHLGNHPNNKNAESSLFLYDASYLRLKNVEIGYNLPQRWLKKIHLQRIRVYVQALNLFTIDGLGDVDMDPETQDGDGTWYPIQRVINFGINITY